MPDPTDAELLSLVKQALSGTLTRNAAALRSVAGRQIQALSIPELVALRRDLEARLATAGGSIRPVVVRFREPS